MPKNDRRAMEVAAAGNPADYTEASDAEDSDDEQGHWWTCSMDPSTYTGTMVMSLTSAGKCSFILAKMNSSMLLIAIAAMQYMVIQRVKLMGEANAARSQELVFGSCRKQAVGEMAHPTNFITPADYSGKDMEWDCSPLTPTIMTNMAALDINLDGFWSQAEAVQTSTNWAALSPKTSTLPDVFYYYQRISKTGGMMGQWDSPFGKTTVATAADTATWSNATAGFTLIPMPWLLQESNKLDLCFAIDKDQCGNLEARGVLALKLPWIVPNAADPQAPATDHVARKWRMAACKTIIGTECPMIYGLLYSSYDSYQGEACGAHIHTWNQTAFVTIVDHKISQKYTGGATGVTSYVYMFFLMLIVGIWWMSLFEEIRLCLDWWIIICLMPTKNPAFPEGGHMFSTNEDGSMKIEAMGLDTKIFQVILHVIPRTTVAFALALYGTDFLVTADDYQDLILNSVALGFLITIDEMLFGAVFSKNIKRTVDACEPMKVMLPSGGFAILDTIHKYHLSTMGYSLVLVAVAIYYNVNAYVGPKGKYELGKALECLCDGEGYGCLAAKVLGGDPYLVDVVL